MTFRTAILMFLLAATTYAVEMWTNSITGEVSPWPPRIPGDRLSVPGGWYVENGWTRFDEEQQAAWDSRVAEEIAEAAQAAYPSPEVILPCVDDDGNVIPELTARLVVRASTWTLLAPTNSASPQKAWSNQQDQIRRLIAMEDARTSKIASGKAKNSAANTVPQLRLAVADLFEALP